MWHENANNSSPVHLQTKSPGAILDAPDYHTPCGPESARPVTSLPGIGNWELGIGNWELGVGSWELGVASCLVLCLGNVFPVAARAGVVHLAAGLQQPLDIFRLGRPGDRHGCVSQ